MGQQHHLKPLKLIAGCILFETANIVEIFWNFAEVKATVMDHYYWNHR